MDLCSDKRNLILIFLTLTVYYLNIPIPCLKFSEGKLEYLLYPFLYPNFTTLIFNTRYDFDLYMRLKRTINSVKSYAIKYFKNLAFSQMQHHCITYVTHINACKITIKLFPYGSYSAF